MQTFIAFPASARLHDNTTGFIQRMRDGATRTEPEVMKSIMEDFTGEALHTFFILPSRELKLGGGMMRIVEATVATIRGAASLIIGRTAPKLDIQQNREVADYMDIMRICLPDAAGNEVWQVSFPLKKALREQVHAGLVQLDAGQTANARETLANFLLGMTDEALFWYFEQPMALLHLGPILSRMAKVGTETARKASQAVINRVFRKLEDEQLKVVGDFLRQLLVECEPRRPEQAIG